VPSTAFAPTSRAVTAPLYNATILRLAASIPHHERLDAPMATSEKRSPVCGSRVTVDVDVDSDGRVSAVGLLVRACALGQASAALMASEVVGKSPDEIAATSAALSDWLTGTRDVPPDWPGLDIFDPARPHSARHPSIRLAFEAAAEAAAAARAR
jgi:NifU-like protein involved in Fe-S cluster formation